MIQVDRADHSRAKLDHDLIVPITSGAKGVYRQYFAKAEFKGLLAAVVSKFEV